MAVGVVEACSAGSPTSSPNGGSGAGLSGASQVAGAAGNAGTHSGGIGNAGAGNGGGSSGSAGASGSGATSGAGTLGGAAGAGAGGGSSFAPYVCPPGPFTVDLSALGAPTRVSGAPLADSFNNDGNNFTVLEGPVWISGALYFSEFGSTTKPPPSRILKIDANDNVSVAFPSVTDTGSNGLAVDSAGNVVAASHGLGGIVRFPLPSGSPMSTLASMYTGHRFDSPNDLTVRADGAIYFTDFLGDQTPSSPPQGAPAVYLLPAGSQSAVSLFVDNNDPNGVSLSLDEKTLYVGDKSGVMKYAVNADGTITMPGSPVDALDLSNQTTDGMVLDCAGDLYVVRVNQHDIVVVSPAGQKLANISVPGSGQITNVAFGGSDHRTLYITVMGTGTTRGVFKLAMPLPGMPF